MKIDLEPIKTELQDLAGNCKVKVKLDKRMSPASSIRQTDNGFDVRLNPSRFRSQNKLDTHLQYCRDAVTK